MQITLHASYLAALMHIATVQSNLDEIFTITLIEEGSEEEQRIRHALSGRDPHQVLHSYSIQDVKLMSCTGDLLGYVRSYLLDDGIVQWTHTLIVP